MKNSKKITILLLVVAIFSTIIISNAAPKFADVPEDHPYAEAICFYADKGVVSGVGDNKFAPDNNLDIDSWMVIFSRVAGIATQESRLPDSKHWASGYAKKLCEAGYLEAYDDAYLDALHLRSTMYKHIFQLAEIPTYPASHYSINADTDAGTTAALLTGLISLNEAAPDTKVTRGEALHMLYTVFESDVPFSVPTQLALYIPTVLDCNGTTRAAQTLANEVAVIPNNLAAGLIKSGYRYVVVDDVSKATGLYLGGTLAGLNDYENHIVFLDNDYIGDSAVHETGHAISTISDGWKKQKELYPLEKSGASRLFGSYGSQNSSEFMAESIRYVIENWDNESKMNTMKSAMPKTYDYIVNNLMQRDFGLTWQDLFESQIGLFNF